MDEKQLQALYNSVSQHFDVGDYGSFKTRMSTPEQRKSFYGVVSNKGFDIGDYQSFEDRIGGVKKKDGFASVGASLLVSPKPTSSQSNGSGSKEDFNTWISKQKPIHVANSDDPIKDQINKENQKLFSLQTETNNISSLDRTQGIRTVKRNLESLKNPFEGDGETAAAYLQNKTGLVDAALQEVKKKIDPNNYTEKRAFDALQNIENINNAIKSSPTLEDAAVLYQSDKDKHTGRQVKYLKGDIPNVVKGKLVDDFINNPEVQKLAAHNPDFKQQLDNETKNLYDKFPEYGVAKVRNKLAQAREDRGMNSLLSNNPSVEKMDELVGDLAKNGRTPNGESFSQRDLDIYQKGIRPALEFAHNVGGGSEVIPTTDVLTQLNQGLKEGVGGIGKTIQTIGSISDTKRQDDLTRQAIVDQYSNVSVNPKSEYYKVLGGSAHMVGYLAPMIIGNMAGVPNVITNTMMFMGENAQRSKAMFPGNQMKQNGYTALTTAADVLIADAIPAGKAASGIKSSIRKDVVNIINDFTEQKITSEAAKDSIVSAIKDKLGNIALDNTKNSAIMTGFNLIHNAADAAFGGRDVSLDDAASQAIDDFKTNWFASTPLSALSGGKGQTKMNGDIIREFVENPSKYESLVRDTENPEIIKNYETATKAWDELKDLPIKEDQKGSFLLKDMQQKIFENKAAESTVDVVKEGYEKKAALARIEKDKILDPEMGNKKFIEEMYDEDLLPKGSRMILEDEKGKFSEHKVGDYIKFIAQQANGLDENWKPMDKTPSMDEVPEQIIEAANERWKKEIEEAKPKEQSKVAVIMPEDNKPPDIVPLKKQSNETAINEEANTADQQGQFIPDEKIESGQPTTEEGKGTTEGEGGEEKITGVKKAVTDPTRAANGMPKVEFPKMSSDSDALKEAKQRVDNGEVNPQNMVDRILKEKSNYKNEGEVMDMQYYAHQLESRSQELDRHLSDAKDEYEADDIRSQKMQLSDLIEAQTEAASTAGNQWGKTGNRMQPVINDAGQIFRQQKSDIKDAYAGEVPKEVKYQIDSITKERDDALADKAKVEEQLRQKMAAAAYEKIKESETKKTAKKQSKEDLKKEEQDLLRELKESLKKDAGNTYGGIPLPIKTIETIGKLAVNYAKQGIKGLEELVDKIHSSFPTLNKRDIRDVIANYQQADRLTKKADLLEGKLKTPQNIVNTPPKQQLVFRKSTEWVKQNQRVANADYKMRQLKRKAFESEKNMFQKGLMWLGRAVRLSVLSGYNVLYKLSSAALIGGAIKRIPEQTIGAIYSGIFKGVAERAPIEGYSNARAEAKFYKDFFNPKKFIQNTWEILRSGSSKLTKRLGQDSFEHVPILYLPTDLHQVIKDPLKRATFEASFHNGLVWAEKNGLDINEPLVIQSLETAAYKRANYEIFQESNTFSMWFSAQKSNLDRNGTAGSVAKTLVDIMIPVSTVPTNIVRRLGTTSPLGLLRGSKHLIDAYRKGLENLSAPEAESIMRTLKQGTLGTGLWLMGWLGYKSFGGLYTNFNPNKKRQDDELKSDQMDVNGTLIDKPVQHALPFEIIQLAATARRVWEQSKEEKKSNFESLLNTGLSSIGASIEQIPVLETGVHAVMATKDPYEADKLQKDLKRRFEPQILRETGIIPPDKKSSKPNHEIPKVTSN